MFTGLVEEMGRCEWWKRDAHSSRLGIFSSGIEKDAALGDSISVNGCCLTVTEHVGGLMVFDLLHETLNRTNLGQLVPGAGVNLERSLRVDARLGGHFVQGHVDTTISLLAKETQGADLRLDFEMPEAFAAYIAFKGSVALNGVSLTVADLGAKSFTVWIIPHTAAHTNLGKLSVGDSVNLECDMLAKYAARIMQVRGA